MLRKDLTNLNTGPTFRIGVLGGGQLGRMMIQSAIDLDMRVEVMDPSIEAPCKSLTHRFIQGNLNDADAVYDFGKDLDVITIEIEHVSVDGLRRLEASGVRVIPRPDHIALIQDKGLQKQFFAKHKIQSFRVAHKGNSGMTHYQTGFASTAKGKFDTNIFLKKVGEKFLITQIAFDPE